MSVIHAIIALDRAFSVLLILDSEHYYYLPDPSWIGYREILRGKRIRTEKGRSVDVGSRMSGIPSDAVAAWTEDSSCGCWRCLWRWTRYLGTRLPGFLVAW